jgi:peroxiredoxin
VRAGWCSPSPRRRVGANARCGHRGSRLHPARPEPAAVTGICQGELDEVRDHLPDYENDDTVTLAISVGPPPTHKIWSIQSGFTFPVLSDFWPHGAVSQAYGVFNADAGVSNRGTFVVDRGGIIRFAEMKQPGEQRDQSVWTDALKALGSG